MISGRIMSLCLNNNTELLRTQLDQLHSEIHSTRRKANNARFRLIRLSEAAENLCRQAAKNLRMGQENEAREILVQKKKVMMALEKSKDRVELLDELAAKLNEAISIKEAQLVENVASNLEIDGSDALGAVRIVSPSPGSDNINESNPDEDLRVPESFDSANKATMSSDYSGISSYIDFLNDVNQQLNKIENDLRAISEHPTSSQKTGEQLENSRLSQVSEILAHVCDIRARIHNFVDQIEATS